MKILLVDDSKSARYALRIQLQRHGIDVETADCAESAFEVLKTQLPDAILMDHMMPGLNGFEALEVIREDPRTASIPVVMCTSHEDAEFIATANKKGVFGILPKSAAADLLADILERLKLHIESAPIAMPDVMTSAIEMPAVELIKSPIQPPPIQLPPIATPQLNEEAILALLDTHLAARLPTLIAPLLEAMRHDIDDFRRELAEIDRKSQRLIEDAQQAAAAITAAPVVSTSQTPTFADLQALSTRLSTETLPDLLKRSLETERTHILVSVEQRLRDHTPAPALPVVNTPVFDENAWLSKAHRDAKDTVDAAVTTLQESVQAIEQTVRAGNGRLYGLFATATVLGLGAAAAVFVLLTQQLPAP